MANNRRRNQAEVPGARNALDHLKAEVASELGIPNYDQIDKGALPSRLNGYVGGVMVRKMIEFAEQAMMNNGQALQMVEAEPGATPNEVQTARQSLAQAQQFANALNMTGAGIADGATDRAAMNGMAGANGMTGMNGTAVGSLMPNGGAGVNGVGGIGQQQQLLH